MPSPPKMLTPADVAACVQVEESDVTSAIERGELAAMRVGGCYRISEESYLAWVGASRCKKPPKRAFIAPLFLVLVMVAGSAVGFELGQNESTRITNNVPRVLPFEGSYTLDGQPVDGTVPMSFRLYDQENSPSPKWTSADRMVTVSEGRFSVALGDATDDMIPEDLFASSSLYLQVVAEGNALTPKQRIAPAPQAIAAARAATNFDVPGDLHLGGTLQRATAGGGSRLLGTYCGSTSPTNGKVTYPIGSTDPNAPIGLPAAQRLCEDTCGSPTAHMCTSHEMMMSGQFGIFGPQSPASWIGTMTWAFYYTPEPQASYGVRDCAAMQSDSVGGYGVIVEPTDGGPYTQRKTCDTAVPIACCD